jgi:hypothetical protein
MIWIVGPSLRFEANKDKSVIPSGQASRFAVVAGRVLHQTAHIGRAQRTVQHRNSNRGESMSTTIVSKGPHAVANRVLATRLYRLDDFGISRDLSSLNFL